MLCQMKLVLVDDVQGQASMSLRTMNEQVCHLLRRRRKLVSNVSQYRSGKGLQEPG